jgi:hypothetical protein
MWNLLVTDEEACITPPSAVDIATAIDNENTAMVLDVLNRITDPDIADKINVNLSEVVPSVYSSYGGRYHATTIMGKAILSSTAIMEFLLERKVPLIATGTTNPLLLAIEANRTGNVIRKLYEHDERILSFGEETNGISPTTGEDLVFKFLPLHYVIRLQEDNELRMEQFRTIHELGASIYATDKDSNTCLHYACGQQKNQILAYLLDHVSKDDLFKPGALGKNCFEILLSQIVYSGRYMHTERLKTEALQVCYCLVY